MAKHVGIIRNAHQKYVIMYGGPYDGVKLNTMDGLPLLLRTEGKRLNGVTVIDVYERVHMDGCQCVAYVYDVSKAVNHRCDSVDTETS